ACEVWFRHAPGGRRAEYERVLQCTLRFRQAETRIALYADAMARPLATANPQVAAWVAGALEQQRTRPASTLGDRLAEAVGRGLARRGRVSREGMARALGMSGRTLARRLRLEQLDFHHVLTEARRSLAERLVADAALPLEAVAAQVGFADLSAFGKAFRRWFGTTPSAHRRAAQRRSIGTPG
ncbi:MAG: helix-turn-helix domain-containing protein, partial [Candidatus Binatia bacterium]